MSEKPGFENANLSDEERLETERKPTSFRRVAFEEDGKGYFRSTSPLSSKGIILAPSGGIVPQSGETYTVRVLNDITDPQDFSKKLDVVEIIDRDDDIEHTEAHLDKSLRMRENPTFRTLARLVNGDPDLSAEYRMVTERAREFKGEQDPDEMHRMYTPLFAALMHSDRGSDLLNLAIDRTVERDSDFIKNEIAEGNNYAIEVVIGSGVHSAIWNLTRQMYVPKNPALTAERQDRIGGQFAQYGGDLFRKNDRMRPELRDTPHLPGTEQSLTSYTDLAPFQQADMTHESYPMQTVTADTARINLFLSGRMMTSSELQWIGRNFDPKANGKGDYILEFLDSDTGKVIEVKTDRVVFTTGVGKERTNFDESDETTKEILEEEKKGFEEGKDAKVMSYTEFSKRMADPAEPFPLQGMERLILSGKGDSAIVVAGVALGYETQVGKTSAQLDRVKEIIWLGPDFMTKEEFIEKCRARYHWVGLEFPREKFEEYYHRIKPVPQARVRKLERDGGDIVAVCEFGEGRNKKVQTFQGDHYIYTHGFEDRTDELVAPISNIEYKGRNLAGVSNKEILTTQYGQIFYKKGPIKKLQVLEVANISEGGFLVKYRRIGTDGTSNVAFASFSEEELSKGDLKLPQGLLERKNISRIEVGGGLIDTSSVESDDGNEVLGTQYADDDFNPVKIYKAGPAAKLPLTEEERRTSPVLDSIPENTNSIFRYADLTAKLSKKCAREDAKEPQSPQEHWPAGWSSLPSPCRRSKRKVLLLPALAPLPILLREMNVCHTI